MIPWSGILDLIEPHHPKAGNGAQSMLMERILRAYFVQQWFSLSGPAAEDSLQVRSKMTARPGCSRRR